MEIIGLHNWPDCQIADTLCNIDRTRTDRRRSEKLIHVDYDWKNGNRMHSYVSRYVQNGSDEFFIIWHRPKFLGVLLRLLRNLGSLTNYQTVFHPEHRVNYDHNFQKQLKWLNELKDVMHCTMDTTNAISPDYTHSPPTLQKIVFNRCQVSSHHWQDMTVRRWEATL